MRISTTARCVSALFPEELGYGTGAFKGDDKLDDVIAMDGVLDWTTILAPCDTHRLLAPIGVLDVDGGRLIQVEQLNVLDIDLVEELKGYVPPFATVVNDTGFDFEILEDDTITEIGRIEVGVAGLAHGRVTSGRRVVRVNHVDASTKARVLWSARHGNVHGIIVVNGKGCSRG